MGWELLMQNFGFCQNLFYIFFLFFPFFFAMIEILHRFGNGWGSVHNFWQKKKENKKQKRNKIKFFYLFFFTKCLFSMWKFTHLWYRLICKSSIWSVRRNDVKFCNKIFLNCLNNSSCWPNYGHCFNLLFLDSVFEKKNTKKTKINITNYTLCCPVALLLACLTSQAQWLG